MKYCNDCHTFFTDAEEKSEIHFEVNTRDREWFSVCPNCKGSDFQEAELCPCREEYVEPYPKNKWGICESCRDSLDFELAEIRKIFPRKVLVGDQSTVEKYIMENLWKY